VSTVSSTKPEILEIEFLKEILQSLGLGNAGLLLDAKKRELLYSMKHSSVLQILKGKKKKNKSTVLNLAGFLYRGCLLRLIS
jgi:penicillin-binding protein-related factor A (putative recombinase)